MNLTLHVWRQRAADAPGAFVRYEVASAAPEMSFLEMLDALNERLAREGGDPIAFDSDCREGICGACGFVINGVAHGPQAGGTVCQLHLRSFRDGEELWLEPWRARAFPIVRDLVVDRGALDRIIAAGGYVTAPTGSAPEANAVPVAKPDADAAMDAAACIGCGACVAACPNASASLFTAAKVAHLAHLPQGQPERRARAIGLVAQAEREGFGGCSNVGACEAVCPKGIRASTISLLNRDHLLAVLAGARR
ncbi:MAG TPA: succinate dehydrogenase/fumarate reductase iron-sulfur subunit [Polyangia bacterium]|jgi:succinate dehydrogenase / fumarate reductase iron-sulfur subunit|nr:succinate dehydrogenase/fumarate reductase iron-sulfur subunit [Polyangia bacterium]